MTPEQLATLLHGREYGETDGAPDAHDDTMPMADVVELAKAAGLVIVHGASDDLIEFDGAVYDERNAPGTVMVDEFGTFQMHDEMHEEDLAEYLRAHPTAVEITSHWDVDGYSWTYTTDHPHATFDIMEDGERYCRGIVFRLPEAGSQSAKALIAHVKSAKAAAKDSPRSMALTTEQIQNIAAEIAVKICDNLGGMDHYMNLVTDWIESELMGTPYHGRPRQKPPLCPDPQTYDAQGNPRTKRLALDPDLVDGSAWTIHDEPNEVLLDLIRAWMAEASDGDEITLKLRTMSAAEAEGLPEI